MSIRNKLILMLAIPLAALAVVGAFGFRSQSTAALEAAEALEQDAMVQSLNRSIKAIGGERLAGAESVNSVFAPLIERRQATDAALTESLAMAGELGLPAVESTVLDAIATMDIVRATENLKRIPPITIALRAARDDVVVTYPTQDSFAIATSVDIAVDIADRQDSIWIEYIVGNRTTTDLARRLRAEIGATELLRQQIVDLAPSDHTASLTEDLAGLNERNLRRAGIDAINLFDRGDVNLLDVPTLATVVESHNDWHEHAIALQEDGIQGLEDIASAAEARQNLFASLATLGLIVLFGLIYVVYRSVVQPLDDLLAGAEEVATHRLPSVVADLRKIGSSDTDIQLEPLPRASEDELGSLVDAFNDVQLTAFDLAVEQARSRRNIAEMFVNLGRRNQKLLQRMLSVISDLEHDEKNADKLEQLFQLDHMTTRMRRNAESLLVVAGTTTPRQWARPVPAADVVRSALAEVQDYHRVDVLSLEEAPMTGNAVADVTHLMAELLENSLQFSEPESRVTVSSRWKDGDYRIVITDQGFGMTPSEMADNNALIADPPPPDQAPTRFLGLFVVGHLAARHGIRVELTDATIGGTDARITIPGSVMSESKPAESRPTELGGDDLPLRADAAEIDLDAELAKLTETGEWLDSAPNGTESAAAPEAPAPTGSFQTKIVEGDLPGKPDSAPTKPAAMPTNQQPPAPPAAPTPAPPAPTAPVARTQPASPAPAPTPDLPVRGAAPAPAPAADLPVRGAAPAPAPAPAAADLPVRGAAPAPVAPAPAATAPAPAPVAPAPAATAPAPAPVAPAPATAAPGSIPRIDFSEAPVASAAPAAPAAPAPAPAPLPVRSQAPAAPPANDLAGMGLPQRTPRATLQGVDALPTATPSVPVAAPASTEPEDVTTEATNVGSMFSAFQAGVQRGERSSN